MARPDFPTQPLDLFIGGPLDGECQPLDPDRQHVFHWAEWIDSGILYEHGRIRPDRGFEITTYWQTALPIELPCEVRFWLHETVRAESALMRLIHGYRSDAVRAEIQEAMRATH